MKTTSTILQFFCYDYFENLLASVTFAKKFGFLAGVRSFQNIRDCKWITIKKSIFAYCIWKKLFVTSPYHNNRAQKLDSRKRMHVLCKFRIFAKNYILQNFFPKVNSSLKTDCAFFFRAS